MRHGVDRQVDPDPVPVRIRHGFGQLLAREIVRGGPHAEGFSGKIDGVAAVQDGRFHFFQIARGGQQFRHVGSFQDDSCFCLPNHYTTSDGRPHIFLGAERTVILPAPCGRESYCLTAAGLR